MTRRETQISEAVLDAMVSRVERRLIPRLTAVVSEVVSAEMDTARDQMQALSLALHGNCEKTAAEAIRAHVLGLHAEEA